MTRENKLAMVVGFGLLLFVGILVSDHFSTAQRQENANLVTADKSRDRVRGPVTIAAMPVAGATALQPAEVMPTSVPGDVRQASNESAPASEARPASPDVRPISNLPGAAPDKQAAAPTKTAAAPDKAASPKAQESEPGVRMHPVAEGETLYSICAKTYGDGTLWKELAEYNKKALPNPAQLRKGVTLRLPPVEQLRHGGTVASKAKGARVNATPSDQDNAALRSGTTLETKPNQSVPLLAAAEVAVVDMHPAVIGDRSAAPDAGAKPAQAVSKSGVIEIEPKKSKQADKTAAPRGDAKSKGSVATEEYVVQKGDTLASIARKKLGKSGKWQDIVAANGPSLSDPAALKPGMTIKLPKAG